MDNGRTPNGLGLDPVVLQDRPQRLVQIFPIPEERSTKHAFLDSAQLPQRPVPAPVLQRGARLEPMAAPSVNIPVPQHSGASAKPHSAVPKAGSSERTWKIPTAVSDPFGTIAKHRYSPDWR